MLKKIFSKKKTSQTDFENAVITGTGQIAGEIQPGSDVIEGSSYTNVSHFLQMKGFKPGAELAQDRNQYLVHLRDTYHALDFKGIPQLETFSRELLLEEVYVPLLAQPEMPSGGETWERRLAGRILSSEALPEEALEALGKGQAAPARVEEVLGQHKQVVVLGDPGSGKTTLLKHLALRLADEIEAPLPILLSLSAYADALSRANTSFQDFLPKYFVEHGYRGRGLRPLFDSAIAQGRAVILLDGLDEVQNEQSRRELKHKVEAFAAQAAQLGNKLLVTSRIVGYRESPLEARDWILYTLLDFDQQAIEKFATRWCLAFEKSTLGDTPEVHIAAEKERRSLLEAVETNPRVAQLASNPLLLTILALIKRQGVTLPNRRVQLYEIYLNTLITAWSKARSLDKNPVGPQLDYLETVAILGPLALWLREENPTAGLVPGERLVEWLTAYFMGEDWGMKRGEAMQKAQEFLDSIRKYSNLLLERGQGRFGFIHLTFEEALAARGLVQLGQLKIDDSLVKIQKYLVDPGWRETILLAVGVWGLVREQPKVAGEVVRGMLRMECSGENACQNVLMAGACLEDVGELGLGRAAATEVKETLLAICHNRSLPPATQRDAGFILGRAGWKPEDLEAFISISPGPFLSGDEKGEVIIPQPFSIAKYPVTNLQYLKFVQEGGYEQPQFWSEDGWAWRTGTYDSKAPDFLKDWLKNRPDKKRNEPYYWHDSKWNNPLAPVVGVSWFEAEAYCKWATSKEGRLFRLPSEEEWERAASGTERNEYPWGNEFDRRRLNCAEFWGEMDDLSDYEEWKKWFGSDSYRLGSTTIVSQFPEGNTPTGVSDISGNVWEWTASWYEEARENRVLRGGAWYSGRRYCRCAYRYRDIPDYFNNYVGFRVVSPGSISGC